MEKRNESGLELNAKHTVYRNKTFDWIGLDHFLGRLIVRRAYLNL